jgi:prepilin-type N-terminal cleavage/methylation domain-containing protein
LLNQTPPIKSFGHHEAGFSLIELIIVVLVISILAVLSIMSFKGEKKYLADHEALIVLDLLNEAKQRALTQHETMRVEINKTKNTITLITENTAGNASDDQIIKSLPLQHQNYVTFEKAPTNVSNSPVDSAPVPALTFAASTHPLSLSDQVATLRFNQTGTVFNAGSNSVGANATSTGATIYFWMPNYSSSGQVLGTGNVIRAITLLGSTGTTKYWKCPVPNNTGQCANWEQ